jgi:hypothetical protein
MRSHGVTFGGAGLATSLASVTLTDEQIMALPSVPYELAPAPGEGKSIIPGSILVIATGTGDYTNVDTNNIIIQFTFGTVDTDHVNWCDMSQDLGVGLAHISIQNYIYRGDMATGSLSLPPALFDNMPLQLDVVNGELGNFTGGDPANTLKILVYYTILDL